VSEGIEVASFARDVSDFDGEYVVEEPPITEASVVGLTSKCLSSFEDRTLHWNRRVRLLAETVPVTPKPTSAEQSSSNNHNGSDFLMPIFCDPSVSDPIISSGNSHPQQTPPHSIKLPDTPHIIISPHFALGQPTLVSVPISTSLLHNFSRQESPSEGSSGPSGLFTPREGESISVDTGDVFGMPSPSHADLPLPSSDDVMASVTSALASRSEIDTTPTDVSDNVAVTEPGPAGTFTGNKEDDRSELVEAMQLDISHPSSVNVDAENEIDQLPTKPAARHHSVAEDTLVASPESEEVQQVARNTLPTVSDQMPPSDHDKRSNEQTPAHSEKKRDTDTVRRMVQKKTRK
jgi:hypothetical protein